MGLKPELPPGVFVAYMPNAVRAIKVGSDGLAGKSVGTIESGFAQRGQRVFIASIRRGETIATASPPDVILAGDVVALAGPSDAVIAEAFGNEVHDAELLDLPLEQLDVVVTNPTVAGMTVEELLRGRARASC